jgi:ribosomal protein L35
MKTKSAAKKRLRLSAGGKVLRRRAFKSHLLEHKSAKRGANAATPARRPLTTVRRCASWARGRRAMARVKRSVHARGSAERCWNRPRATAA